MFGARYFGEYFPVPSAVVGFVATVCITSARWTKKPPPGTDLDRTHPFCPDHCWPFLGAAGTPQSLSRAVPLAAPSVLGEIYAGSSLLVPGGKYGLSVRHGATTDQLKLTATASGAICDQIVGLTGNLTMLWAYRKTDGTTRQNAFGVNGSLGGSDICDILMNHSDGGTYWRYNSGSTDGTDRVRIVSSTITFGDDLWMVSIGPRGMELWQNGIMLGSATGQPTRTNAGSYFGWPAGVTTWSDLADTALIMTWNRQLPKAAIRSLSHNPWQVFQPTSHIILSAASIIIPPSGFPALNIAV
jgi:hypothetical protein